MIEKWGIKPRYWNSEAHLQRLFSNSEELAWHRQLWKDIGMYDGAVLTDGDEEIIVDEEKAEEFLRRLNLFGNLWQR